MSGSSEEKLSRNDMGRWQIGNIQLTSGSSVELLIEGHWICGVVEFWRDDYYWFSQTNGIPVILGAGISAREPRRGKETQNSLA